MRAYDACGDTQVDTRAMDACMCLNNSMRFTLCRPSKLYKISHRGGSSTAILSARRDRQMNQKIAAGASHTCRVTCWIIRYSLGRALGRGMVFH